ncbi:Kynurenine 3-monooxygenase [Cordyceps militaris]|uniref:Kynurenine 3-monooxygenase n=1 Tax=Cordyceps militaris TaxID=73501 RepID=A0A2H4S7Y3_CORMI|nr:Kynurenine 3-monooxygenase [Cordyceps militaris]
MARPQKMVIVGAGPVGSLAALYAAQRGYQVEVYELRPDLRDPRIVPLNFTKSINLALSERGINAIRHAGLPDLLQDILGACVPMRGRMIHGKKPSGALYQVPQDFDAHGRCNLAMDRGALNARLLDALEDLPNVELFFNHKLTGADFRARKAWIEDRDRLSPSGRPREIEIAFDLMLGADGAHSAVRYHLMKFSRMDYQQEYIDTLWCEFRIDAGKAQTGSGAETWKISPNHLHIWPGKDFMFIAIPSEDGSFTCTLFLPASHFATLEADPSQVPNFFDVNFPGVRDHISDASLIEAFNTNPHLPLISLKCKPYHFGSSGVILGDAAHAMVPFYGQGMNTGMEDVRLLFAILDKHQTQLAETNNPLSDDSDDYDAMEASTAADAAADQAHAQALAEYSATRWVDAHTINDLAFQNYVEMRTSQSTTYKLRKALEEFMSLRFPCFGWQTKYSLVVFSNRPYSECVRRTDRQGRVLMRVFAGLVTSPLLAAGVWLAYSYRRPMKELWHNAVAIWQMM